MNILFVTSEASPFAKSGGLGDVSGSLPGALSMSGENNVCVIMPLYGFIKRSCELEYVGNTYVPLSWRQAYAGIFKKRVLQGKREITYYFIDNDYYFDRNSMYGECDDGERFAFFSKACLECLPITGFFPDIMHLNDWQTGFVPLFLKTHYRDIDMYRNIRTVFTIHNIEYQGKADPDFLTDVLGVDEYMRGVCTFDGLINAMKTAIVMCDRFTTVSETYSHEIKYAYFAHGLESIINEHSQKLSGVVNGIDTTIYTPSGDASLPCPYNIRNMTGKEKCKASLRQRLSLGYRAETPIVSIISRLVPHKGVELVEYVINELCSLDIQLVILGTGNREYEDMFRHMEYTHGDRVRALITFDSQLAKEVYAGSDFLLMPSKSEPCGLSQLIAMRYGCIPIVHETGGLVDTVVPFNPGTGEGTGITFKVFNAHDMLGAVIRAGEIYRDKASMTKLRTNAMSRDSSWETSAKKYIDIYHITERNY